MADVDTTVPLSRSAAALLASCLVHVAFVLAGVRIAAAARTPAPSTGEAESADTWIGETFEIGDSVATAAPAPAAPAAADPAPAAAPQPGEVVAAAAIPVPEPAAHRPKPRKPKPRPASSGGASSLQASGSASAAPGSGGPFGMNGQAPGGPRDLSRAFTRAIPIAISPDPAWAALPLGPAGSFELRIELGEDGRISSARPVGPVSDHLRSVGARTVALLGAGTFAIKAEPGAGSQVLRISAVVTMVEAAPSNDASQAGAYGLGYEPPGGDRPGKAWFTLRSGKHVEVTVGVLR